MSENPRWLSLATNRKVVLRALKMALIVGSALAAINHGDALIHGAITTDRLLKILMTFCVPYLVSTYSSVSTLRELAQTKAEISQTVG